MKTTNLTKQLQLAVVPLLALFGGSSIAVLAADCAPDLAGIAACWHAEGNALDSIGQNSGALQGGVSFSAGIVGQCFAFDGSSGFIELSNNASMDFGTNDFTIAGWVRFSSLETQPEGVNHGAQEIIHKEAGPDPNYQNYFLEYDQYPDGRPGLRLVVNDGMNMNDLLVPAPLAVATWYHICAVRASNTNRIYLDGSLLGEQASGSNVDTGAGGMARIGRVANDFTGLTRYFRGNIDELRLYSRALTSGEIRQLAGAPTLSICVSGAGVELCWTSMTNGMYQVEYSSDPTTNSWTALGDQISAVDCTTCQYDAVPSTQPQRFYRVSKLPW